MFFWLVKLVCQTRVSSVYVLMYEMLFGQVVDLSQCVFVDGVCEGIEWKWRIGTKNAFDEGATMTQSLLGVLLHILLSVTIIQLWPSTHVQTLTILNGSALSIFLIFCWHYGLAVFVIFWKPIGAITYVYYRTSCSLVKASSLTEMHFVAVQDRLHDSLEAYLKEKTVRVGVKAYQTV